MSRIEKLTVRFLEQPSDFTWKEMCRLLESLGYKLQEGSGSRCCFLADGKPRIRLHRPHPTPIVKQYILKQVKQLLEENNML